MQRNFKMNSIKCSKCGGNDHSFRKCPRNTCRTCGLKGHIMVNCSIQKCTNCRKTGHLIGECPDIRCNFCQGKGHMKGECPRNGPEPSQRRFPMIYRSSINQAVENLASQIVSDIPKHVEYAWRDKDGVVHDTNETNWENNWPKCINCGKVAYISNHADKPKC